MADDNMDLAWFKMDSSIVIQTNCGSILIPDDVRTLHFRIDMLIHLHLIKHVNLNVIWRQFLSITIDNSQGGFHQGWPRGISSIGFESFKGAMFRWRLHVSFWFLSGGLMGNILKFSPIVLNTCLEHLRTWFFLLSRRRPMQALTGPIRP